MDDIAAMLAEQKRQGIVLAKVAERLDHSRADQKRLLEVQDGLVESVQGIRVEQAACAAQQRQRWDDHDTEHDNLNKRKNQADAVIGFGSAMGIVLGWLGLNT